MTEMEELRGWLSGSKGQRYLATDQGWFELLEPDGTSLRLHGDFDRRPARVVGERADIARFIVHSLKSTGSPAERRAPFAVSPPRLVHLAARARGVADRFLQDRGIPQVMLPALWTVSREYGEEELSVSHPALPGSLALLQSPEFPMYASLAMGVGSFYCWGRSYRFEEQDSLRHLMEFEQIDIGFSHGDLAEMLELVEGLVRAVAADLEVAVAEGPFPSRPDAAPEPPAGMVLVELRASLPADAIEIILRRLGEVGADATLIQQVPPVIAVSGEDDEEVDAAVARVLDSVQRITAGETGPGALRPWWRSPLPLHWEDEAEASRSEYRIRTITSARLSDDNGTEWVAEAELYIGGLEVAHAGVFADHQTFLRNLDEAEASRSRYEWLIPVLEDAPPGMIKVGVGWERLVAALLGDCEPTQVQLFPRLGGGELVRRWT